MGIPTEQISTKLGGGSINRIDRVDILVQNLIKGWICSRHSKVISTLTDFTCCVFNKKSHLSLVFNLVPAIFIIPTAIELTPFPTLIDQDLLAAHICSSI